MRPRRRLAPVGDCVPAADGDDGGCRCPTAFTMIDREARGQDAPVLERVQPALADITTTVTKAAGLNFYMIGPPNLPARSRARMGGDRPRG
jgi:hypothetical protein